MPKKVTVDVHVTADDLRTSLRDDVRDGLAGRPKSMPPVWFYDDRGSRLFEEITRLPEYYLTRAECRLLQDHADDVSRIALADTFVEIGAGVCDKTRLLLDALDAENLRCYVPFDVSTVTAEAARGLVDRYDGLAVHVVIGDFHHHLDRLPARGPRLVAFLGGTIGNLRPEQRAKFLSDVSATMERSDHLLLGTDLVKDRRRLLAAYNDSAGVTAEFNRNLLHVINRELDADFDPISFEHVSCWNDAEAWIEMRLRSSVAQSVTIPPLELEVRFDPGEDLLTEISAKFTPSGIAGELSGAGFDIDGMWGAEEGEFLLTLAHPS